MRTAQTETIKVVSYTYSSPQTADTKEKEKLTMKRIKSLLCMLALSFTITLGVITPPESKIPNPNPPTAEVQSEKDGEVPNPNSNR